VRAVAEPMQRPTARVPREPSAPRQRLPAGACDAHLHVFAAEHEFARDPRRREEPAPGDLDTWLSRLQRQMAALGLARAVLVQSVVYREDNASTLAALERLGTTSFRGVALAGPEASTAALRRLHERGVRGIRLNFRHGGALDLAGLQALAPRLAEAGLHAQVLGASPGQLDDVVDALAALPVPVVLDHHAAVRCAARDRLGPRLLRWFEAGRLFVKLSAAYRIDEPPYQGHLPLVRTLLALRPDRLVWGSDWPYVMFDGPEPDAAALLDALETACGSRELVDQVLVQTPQALYGFDPVLS
jgi:D-galactarolactone isomerase